MAGAVRVCTSDGSEHFPRVDPAMIVLVQSPDGNQAVLGRGAQWPHPFFSCLAGFVEPGESAEQAVIREVAEEVGIVGARCSVPGVAAVAVPVLTDARLHGRG